MPARRVNSDKPHLWKADILQSVDQFNEWFVKFAPAAFRKTRVETTEFVKVALKATNDLRKIDEQTLQLHPGILATLRMCTAPPLAVDRLIGLSKSSKSLVGQMERGKLAARMPTDLLKQNLSSICRILNQLLDRDIFLWLESSKPPTPHERDRAATVIADRLCSAIANPIVRNAQEQRQLEMIGSYLNALGYQRKAHPTAKPLKEMEAGTYTFRLNVRVGENDNLTIPIDVVIQPKQAKRNRLPLLIEAKSAGDFTNTNKRRKEEATKIRQLKAKFGESISLTLFLCGYFGSDYLGYEAAEGIDWVWEHRIADLLKLGV